MAIAKARAADLKSALFLNEQLTKESSKSSPPNASQASPKAEASGVVSKASSSKTSNSSVDDDEPLPTPTTNGSSVRQLGLECQMRGDLDKAIEFFSRDTDPRFRHYLTFALLKRGDRWNTQGKTDEAIRDFTRIIELEKEDKSHLEGALYRRGLTYENQNNFIAAEADFARLEELYQEEDNARNQSKPLNSKNEEKKSGQ